MDVARLGNRNDLFLEERGQSTVEYLLLLAVVIALLTTVFNSARFKALIGENGQFAQAIKAETQWNYRHGLPGRDPNTPQISFPGATHPTYFNSARSTSHFFAPKDPYPL